MGRGAEAMVDALCALCLVAQALIAPTQGYTTPEGALATPDGRYALSFGWNCDAIGLGQNVEVYFVSNVPGQAMLAPLDETGRVATAVALPDGTVQSQLCSVLIERASDLPCALNAEGLCDVA